MEPVVVRCTRGALFETLWVPLASLKAVRLGLRFRLQRCPVHHRWEIISQVSPETLTPHERAEAARHPAGRIP